MTIFFILLEALEVADAGAAKYFTNIWNVADWLNFCLFFITWGYIFQMKNFSYERSTLCDTVGYCDDWKMMKITRSAKLFLSFCICIQLLKIIKFTDEAGPPMPSPHHGSRFVSRKYVMSLASLARPIRVCCLRVSCLHALRHLARRKRLS